MLRKSHHPAHSAIDVLRLSTHVNMGSCVSSPPLSRVPPSHARTAVPDAASGVWVVVASGGTELRASSRALSPHPSPWGTPTAGFQTTCNISHGAPLGVGAGTPHRLHRIQHLLSALRCIALHAMQCTVAFTRLHPVCHSFASSFVSTAAALLPCCPCPPNGPNRAVQPSSASMNREARVSSSVSTSRRRALECRRLPPLQLSQSPPRLPIGSSSLLLRYLGGSTSSLCLAPSPRRRGRAHQQAPARE